MRNRKLVIVAVAALSVALVGGSIAWAAWSSSASGTGTANSTTSVNSTITPNGTGNVLYPGAVASYDVTVNNPNQYPVKVTSISAGSSNEVGGCTAGTVTSDAVASAPDSVIAAGATGVYTLTVRMNADAADACKAQTFTLPLTAALTSAA